MKISKKLFGHFEEEEVYEYTLSNSNHLSLSIISYGGIITSIKMPDHKGKIGELTVNFKKLDEIVANRPFHGAIIGPVAGRIAKGKYYDGEHLIELDQNEGENTLHSGYQALDNRNWQVKTVQEDNEASIILNAKLKDGEAGFPGNVNVQVSYTLNETGEIKITYEAESDKRTLFNPTNHVYFNLSGDATSPIYDHELKLNSLQYAVLDDENIPTGELKKVDRTAFDFRKGKSLDVLNNTTDKSVRTRDGFDHPFLLGNDADEFGARLYHEKTGRLLEMRTSSDAVVIYTHNQKSKTASEEIGKHCGIALETSQLPDAVNQESFGSIWLEKGEKLHSETIFQFSIK